MTPTLPAAIHRIRTHARTSGPSQRPAIKSLRQTAWLACAVLASTMHAQAASLHVTVLDKEGKPLPDAVVVVVPSAKSTAKMPPPLQATINQEKMQFIPAVTVVSRGARVRFVNNDAWDHHVRLSPPGLTAAAAPGAADGVALRLEGKSDGKPAKFADVTLDKPGALGANVLGCFIHGSMSGHVYVAESPWTVKTGADGVALLNDLPDGTATVQVWHGLLTTAPKPQPTTLGANAGKATVQLDVLPRKRRN